MNGGGSVERTFQMSRFLARAGVACAICTTDLGLTEERKKALAGVEINAAHCYNRRFYLSGVPYREMKRLVGGADIIHLMNHWTAQNAIVYLLARRMRKPYVVCAAGALPVYGRSRALKILYNLLIGRRIVRNADFCIAITPAEVEQYRAYGADPGKITVIPNGITGDDLLAKDDAGFREKFKLDAKRIILFVGRLNPIKGPDLLLRAFCNLKGVLRDHQLVFIGPDEGMLSALKKTAAENEVEDRVSFLGHLGGADKSHAYNAADLVVIPSRKEAMSIVVLEAGMTGKPVLITDQCGFERIAAINGGRVVPASVAGLQQGLLGLLSGPDALESIGGNLKRFVNEHFLWDSLVHEYIRLYSLIVKVKAAHT